MKRAASLLLATALLLACGTVTEVPEVWRDPAFDAGPFQKILVIGVAESADSRRLFEDELAADITAGGTDAQASHTLLPDVGRLSESRVRDAVAGGGFDGVLVTHLVSRGTETTTVTPRPYAVPRVDRGYYGDYNATWEVVQQPDYTVSSEVVRLDTRLYDLRSGKRVWAGRSETRDPRSLAAGVASVSAALTKRLAADGLIR